MAVLAGAGPMGLGVIDLAIHGDIRPRKLVVTDINDARLKRAEFLFSRAEAAENGVDLTYFNTARQVIGDELTGKFDDVFVMAPVVGLIEQADRMLDRDGCMNFFAGPTDTEFSARINFYELHYSSHHIVGTSGGNTEDMMISLELMRKGRINPSVMITHVGGLNAVPETTLTLPKIPGGKKLIYTNVNLPLTAISDFEKLGELDEFWADLAIICAKNRGIWNNEAEEYLVAKAPTIGGYNGFQEG